MGGAKSDSDRANAVRIVSALEALFGSQETVRQRCKVNFARQWTVDGEQLRANWMCGHFMDLEAPLAADDPSSPAASPPKDKKQPAASTSPKGGEVAAAPTSPSVVLVSPKKRPAPAA